MTRPAAAEIGALLALTVLGAALRLATLGADSLWYDEASMYHLVQGDWRAILAANAIGNSAPPLYPLLLGMLTGPAAPEALLRAPAAVAGIAAIPLCWLLARQFMDSPFALLAPLLVALSPAQVEYSQEVREYSLAFAAACLMLIAFARFLESPGGRRAAAVAATSVLGLLIQYGSVLLAAGAKLVCLAAARRASPPGRLLRPWLLAQIPVVVAGLVLLVTTLRPQFGHVAMGSGGYRYLLDRYWDGTASGLWTLLASDRADIVNFAFPGKLMFALTALGAAAFLFRAGSARATALLVAPGAVTIAAALAGLYPFGGIRQNMFLTPMIYVCAALGLAATRGWTAARGGRLPAAAVVAGVVAALAWSGGSRSLALVRGPGNEPMRPIVAELAARVDPGERIYVYWGAVPAFRYYWRERGEPWIEGSTHWSGLDPEAASAQMLGVQRELVELTKDPAPFWLVVSHLDDDDAVALIEPLRERGAVNVVKAVAGSALLRVTPRKMGKMVPDLFVPSGTKKSGTIFQ